MYNVCRYDVIWWRYDVKYDVLWENINFQRLITQKLCQIGTSLLLTTYRKPYMVSQMATLNLTLSDLERSNRSLPRFDCESLFDIFINISWNIGHIELKFGLQMEWHVIHLQTEIDPDRIWILQEFSGFPDAIFKKSSKIQYWSYFRSHITLTLDFTLKPWKVKLAEIRIWL